MLVKAVRRCGGGAGGLNTERVHKRSWRWTRTALGGAAGGVASLDDPFEGRFANDGPALGLRPVHATGASTEGRFVSSNANALVSLGAVDRLTSSKRTAGCS